MCFIIFQKLSTRVYNFFLPKGTYFIHIISFISLKRLINILCILKKIKRNNWTDCADSMNKNENENKRKAETIIVNLIFEVQPRGLIVINVAIICSVL